MGKREALVLGYSVSAGVVINHNNFWDSGISVSGGLGVGIEKSFDMNGYHKSAVSKTPIKKVNYDTVHKRIQRTGNIIV